MKRQQLIDAKYSTTQQYRFGLTIGGMGLIIAAVLFAMLPVHSAHAQGLLNVSIARVTPYMVQDSNNSCNSGPKAMYLQVSVTNTSGSTLNNLSAEISAFTGFTVTLGSGESPTRYIGTLAAGCFQLISNTITASTYTAGPVVGANNRLYFTNANGPSQNSLTVVYYFKALCTGQGTVLIPFQDQLSGGQLKYTGNYGQDCTNPSGKCDGGFSSRGVPIAPASNPFQISKTPSAQSVSSGGVLTYTVRITNTANVPVLLDAITDTLPVGSGLPATTYQGVTAASSVQSANSSYMPSVGSTGTIYWLSKPQQTWSVPANGSINLIYQVQFPVSSEKGTYINTATARTGNFQIGPVGYGVGFNQPTAVALSSFNARADAVPGVLTLAGWAPFALIGLIGAGGVLVWQLRRRAV